MRTEFSGQRSCEPSNRIELPFIPAAIQARSPNLTATATFGRIHAISFSQKHYQLGVGMKLSGHGILSRKDLIHGSPDNVVDLR